MTAPQIGTDILDAIKMRDAARVDWVNHPPHYDFGPHETIDVIEAWDLPYHLGNVVKYVSRAKRKGKELEDLKKAAWYLDRYISLLEKNERSGAYEQSRLPF